MKVIYGPPGGLRLSWRTRLVSLLYRGTLPTFRIYGRDTTTDEFVIVVTGYRTGKGEEVVAEFRLDRGQMIRHGQQVTDALWDPRGREAK